MNEEENEKQTSSTSLPVGFKSVKMKCGCYDTQKCEHENVEMNIDGVWCCNDCGVKEDG